MGLFRLAIVAAVGVSLLPADAEQQEKLYERAASAAHWTVTFCDRNTATCDQAKGVWDQFLKKAEFGAKLAYDALSKDTSPSRIETGTIAGAGTATSRHTLRSRDFEPAWRGSLTVSPPQR